MGKKITQLTILGGSGFLGSALADLLSKKKNTKIIIFDTKKKKYLLKGQKFVRGSILNFNQLKKGIKGSQYVFNFAALADLDYARNKPLKTAEINISGTIKSLIICNKYKVKKFIQASSIYANSEQGGFYGASKKAAEDYIERFFKKFKLKFTILRFGSLYGQGADNNNGINRIIDFALKNKILLYRGSQKAARRYIHVSDACVACSESIKKKYDNKYLNITGPKKIKIKQLLKILSDITNISYKKIIFKNFLNEGHYINEPRIFIPRQGIKFNLKKHRMFKEELVNLYSERRKKYIS